MAAIVTSRPSLLAATGPYGTTHKAPSGALTIATGGTAQQLCASMEIVNGIYIENPLTPADQGVSPAEPLVVSATDPTCAYPGKSLKLQPGDFVNFAMPPDNAIYVVAPTTGHAFSAFLY